MTPRQDRHIKRDRVNDEPMDDALLRELFNDASGDIEQVPPTLFSRIEERINDAGAGQMASPGRLAATWSRLRQWLRSQSGRPRLAWGLAGVQAVAIVLLLIFSNGSPPYHTLSAPQDAFSTCRSVALHVIFKESSRIGDIDRLLLQVGASIVNGPGRRGIYTLAVPREKYTDQADIIEVLKRSPLVSFVGPVY
ncbi:hypothetical protein ACLG6S_00240 [Thermodesulfobacteriota bacterium B35]